jgi:hypothetical protein
MSFGSDRHEMWENESRKTGLLPKCFGLDWRVSHVETEFATEMLPGIVVHSRIDAVCEGITTICDYKTMIAESLEDGITKASKKYQMSRQLLFYAFQVGMHGVRVNQVAYLIEIWNEKQTEILGYHKIIKKLELREVGWVLEWVKDRASLLASAIDNYEELKK